MKKIKSKFILILLLLLLLLLLCSSNVNAYSESFEYNNNTYNCFVPDDAWNTIQTLSEYGDTNYKMFVFTNSGRVEVYFVDKNYDIKMWTDSGFGCIYSNYDTVVSNFSCIHYIIVEKGGSISSVNRNETNFPNGSGYSFYKSGRNLYMYGDFDIYTSNTLETLFFQGAPLVEEIAPVVEKVELMNPMEVEELPGKINQTVKILLAVSLGLFSISSVTLVLLYRIFGKGSQVL